MPDIFLGSLEFDIEGPVFDSFFPAPNAANVPVNTALSFNVTDLGLGVNSSSINVLLNSVPVIVNGIFSPGFSGSISPITNGFSVLVTPGSFLSIGTAFTVDYYAEDLAAIFNDTSGSWSFQTSGDATGPDISAQNPAPAAVNVSTNTPISFITTDVESDIDEATLNVSVNAVTAIVNGVFQSGFTGSIAVVPNGRQVTITPSTVFDSLAVVAVNVEVSNSSIVPVQSTFSWSFTCEDPLAPIITSQNPLPGATDVPVSTNILFTVEDDLAVNELSLNVSVAGTPAIVGGVFQPGFTGSISTVASITSVIIDPDVSFDSYEDVMVSVTAEDTSGNTSSLSWSFICEDLIAPTLDNFIPADGSVDVPHNSFIFFRALDSQSGINVASINATVGGVPAVVDGVQQPGFTVSITAISNGYEVQISPSATFGSYQVIALTASVEDNDGNYSSESWSFRTIDDQLPSISNLTPAPSAIDVSRNPVISFNITDMASGVQLNTLQLTVNGTPAVVNGVVQIAQFTGSVVSIPDGFSVSVTPIAPFAGLVLVNVNAQGEDLAGNLTTVSWSFTTESSIVYLMRAYYLAATDFVYWAAPVPDTSASYAPYPLINLADVVVFDVIDTNSQIYGMRAYRGLSSDYVYWSSIGAPDPSGSGAPYPAVELSDIVVAWSRAIAI